MIKPKFYYDTMSLLYLAIPVTIFIVFPQPDLVWPSQLVGGPVRFNLGCGLSLHSFPFNASGLDRGYEYGLVYLSLESGTGSYRTSSYHLVRRGTVDVISIWMFLFCGISLMITGYWKI